MRADRQPERHKPTPMMEVVPVRQAPQKGATQGSWGAGARLGFARLGTGCATPSVATVNDEQASPNKGTRSALSR